MHISSFPREVHFFIVGKRVVGGRCSLHISNLCFPREVHFLSFSVLQRGGGQKFLSFHKRFFSALMHGIRNSFLMSIITDIIAISLQS